MSIIQSQGTKNTLVNFIGVAVSFFSTLFIYNLDKELYGFAQFLTGTAFFIVPYLTLGVIGLILKFYPQFEESKDDSSFLKSILILTFCANLVFLLFYFLFHEAFIAWMERLRIDRKGILKDYMSYVLILGIIFGYIRVFTLYASNLRRIVVPELITTLSYKLFLPLLILAGSYHLISQEETTWILISFYLLILISLVLYVFRIGKPWGKLIRWTELAKEKQKGIRNFTLFSAMNGLSGSLAFRVDMIMVAAMLGFASNGIFMIILFLTNIIDVPRRSITKIISPILSTAAKANDIIRIEELYKKTSINLLIPSTFIFLLIYALLPELDKIVTGNPIFWGSRYIFLLLALGKVVSSLFSVNVEIITYSKYYKYNLLFITILGLCNVMLNYIFIDQYGIIGAALSTFFAYVFFGLMKFILIWWKMGIHPFHHKTLSFLGIAILTFLIILAIPNDLSFVLGTILKVSLIVLFFCGLTLWFQISSEINGLFRQQWHGLKSRMKSI